LRFALAEQLQHLVMERQNISFSINVALARRIAGNATNGPENQLMEETQGAEVSRGDDSLRALRRSKTEGPPCDGPSGEKSSKANARMARKPFYDRQSKRR
jgi:hypothetical protein